MRRTSIATSILLLAIALVALFTPGPAPAAAQPAASDQVTIDVFAARYLTTTANTAAPNVDTAGRDVSKTAGWGSVDIFVTADISGTGVLTATAQVSADGVNWTNADYEYWNGSAVATKVQQRVLSADGTEYISMPLAGEYWRVNLAATEGVTTTVKATLRR